MEIEDENIATIVPPYMPLRKPNAKPVKELNDGKFDMFTLFLPEEVSFDDELLGRITQLNMEDRDFNDRSKYP